MSGETAFQVGQSHSVGLAGADSALSSNVFDMVLVDTWTP